MGLNLTGLASGLDSAALIKAIMDVEALPKTVLQNKRTGIETRISAFQALNTKLAALQESAAKLSAPSSLRTFTTSSSSDAVKVTGSDKAQAGTLDIVVTQLAQSQTSVTTAMTQWNENPPVLTITAGGKDTTVTASGASLDSVVKAVNDAKAGVTATKIASGTDVNGDTQYRIQFTSNETGADAAFSVARGTAGADLLAEPGAAMIRDAQDAEVTLWAGTGAEQKVISSTNTFTELMPGVDVAVSAVSATPATIDVTRDEKATADTAKGLVTGVQSILAYISANQSVTKKTDSAGNDTTVLGAFTSDAAARTARQALSDAIMAPVDGKSPATIGINLTKTGDIEFDEEAFTAALREDPEAVEAFFTTVAGRVADTGELLSDKYDGLITSKITGQQSESRTLETQIEQWSLRLNKREETLKNIYAALETSISTMNSTKSYLESQIAGLPGWNASN